LVFGSVIPTDIIKIIGNSERFYGLIGLDENTATINKTYSTVYFNNKKLLNPDQSIQLEIPKPQVDTPPERLTAAAPSSTSGILQGVQSTPSLDPMNKPRHALIFLRDTKITEKTLARECYKYAQVAYEWRGDSNILPKIDKDSLKAAALGHVGAAILICRSGSLRNLMGLKDVKEIVKAHENNDVFKGVKNILLENVPALFDNQQTSSSSEQAQQAEAIKSDRENKNSI